MAKWKLPKRYALKRRLAALNGLSVSALVLNSSCKLKAMSRADVEQLVRTVREPSRVAIISIGGGVGTREGHPRFPAGMLLLRTRFNDVLEVSPWPRAVLFNSHHAHRILRFVEQLPAGVETLVVHCWHGVGRSRAVVAALRRLRGEDDIQEFTDGDPNPVVYRTMLEVAIKRASRGR